jgi:hypothetical protein
MAWIRAFGKYTRTCIPWLDERDNEANFHHPAMASETPHMFLMGYVTYNTRTLEELKPKCKQVTNECIEATLNFKNNFDECPCTATNVDGKVSERAGKAYGQCKTSIPGNECFKVQSKYTAESISQQKAATSKDCQELCKAETACHYWNWAYNPHKKISDCYLIDSNSASTDDDAEEFVSGPKECPPVTTSTTTTTTTSAPAPCPDSSTAGKIRCKCTPDDSKLSPKTCERDQIFGDNFESSGVHLHLIFPAVLLSGQGVSGGQVSLQLF